MAFLSAAHGSLAQSLPVPRYPVVYENIDLCDAKSTTRCVVLGQGYTGIWVPESNVEWASRLIRAGRGDRVREFIQKRGDRISLEEMDGLREVVQNYLLALCRWREARVENEVGASDKLLSEASQACVAEGMAKWFPGTGRGGDPGPYRANPPVPEPEES